MPSRVFQPNFTGGVIGKDLYARSDTTKYTTGCKQAKNLLIRPQGGLQNRAGFRVASGFDTGTLSNVQWLMPFSITANVGVHLEFAENVFRVIYNGAYVLDTSFTAESIVDITTADPCQLEMSSPAAAANYSVGDLCYIDDPAGDHALGEQVVRIAGVSSEFLLVEFFDGAGIDTTTGLWGSIGAGAVLEKVYSQTHPYALEDVPFIRKAQDNTEMYLTHRDYPVQRLEFLDFDDWTLAPFVFEPSIEPPAAVAAATITGATKADPVVVTIGAGHAFTEYTTVYLSSVGGMTQLNGNYYVVRNPTATTFELYSTGGKAVDGTSFGTYTSGGTAETFKIRELSSESGTVYEYVISALDAETLEESLQSEVLSINSNLNNTDIVLNWPAVPEAGLYNIYRENKSGFSYIGTTASTVFTDNKITPDSAIQPTQARNPFPQANDYPKLVAFVEQRLALASTYNDPQRTEMSRINAFSNFNVTYPSDQDDAIRFRYKAKELNEVMGFIAGETALIMFTSSAEWTITGNENEGILTPTSIVPRPRSYWGSYDIEPITVGEVAMFVEPSGDTIRDFRLGFSGSADADPTRDLTILVRDLFDGLELTSWTFTKSPDRMIWVTLSDGSLLSLCYMAEHDVWGWTTHELGGENVFVYQVSSVREGARDVLYAVVGRSDQLAQHVIMTERLDARRDDNVIHAFYVDAGLTYDNPGVPASSVSGLLHLRGQEVVALIDGSVVEGLTVDETGSVDFGGVSGDLIHVGLPYEAVLETLDIDFEADGLGSMQGRYKAAGEVAILVKDSRGLSAGQSEDRMTQLIEWDTSMVGGPIPLFTKTVNISVDGDWVRNGTVFVKQTYPLPMTVLGVAPEWEIGE